MNNYKWNINELKQKLNKLKQMQEFDKKCELDIMTLNQMLGNYSNQCELTLNLLQQKEVNKYNDFFIKLASDFYENNIFKRISVPNVGYIDLSIEKELELIHDFYKTCNSNFYANFLNVFNKKNTNLQIINNPYISSGIAYHLLSEKESYININTLNTIHDLEILAHEYAHAITFSMYPNFIANSNFTFIRELDGLFFQTKFLDFLIENNILKQEAILAKVNFHTQMNRKAASIQMSESSLLNTVYLFSYLASIELCMIDNKNPEDILEKIIRENPKSLSETIEILTSYITLNTNVESFQKKLKMQLDNNFAH